MSCDEDLATGACDALTAERLRYFTGRHMTARDFQDEQSYHRSHRLLHNRMLHGWGIVCGLQVRPHPNPDCRNQRVVVRCGLAIDCCGRELVVRRDVVTDVIPWSERPQIDVNGTEMPDRKTVLLLCLEYCEAPTEKVPVLYNESACATASMECGRTREGVRLAWYWVTRDSLAAHGWRTDDECAPDREKEKSPCDDGSGNRRCCLDPECAEHHCVPLAVLSDDPKTPAGPSLIDESGRRPLGEAGARLTHICWVNWPHGDIVSPSWLASHGSLKARFDRELEAVTQPEGICGPRGINPCTFIVEYGEIYEDIDFVPYAKAPYLDADRRTAVFELDDPRPGPGGQYRYLIGHTVYVTIKCEFLLDCQGQAVDGNHVGGRLPTGNGTPGGTFESWFTVVSDEDYKRLKSGEPAQADASYVATEE